MKKEHDKSLNVLDLQFFSWLIFFSGHILINVTVKISKLVNYLSK